MSRESSERGEKKREEIRRIIFNLMCECVEGGKNPKETQEIVNKHVFVMLNKTKPQENHLLAEVIRETHMDMEGFCKRMQLKEKEMKNANSKEKKVNKEVEGLVNSGT